MAGPHKRGSRGASSSNTDEPQEVPDGHLAVIVENGDGTTVIEHYPLEQVQKVLRLQAKAIKRNPALKAGISLPEDCPYELKDGVLHPRTVPAPDKGASE
jgi:hypothetical protein